MATEIERRFVVRSLPPVTGVDYEEMQQGYLSLDPARTVRIRTAGDGTAALTIKGETSGATRDEFEYSIPFADAEYMLRRLSLGRPVRKRRYYVPFGGRTWEIDVFQDDNEGLVVAEIELESPEAHVDLPVWVGEEVTDDPRFANSSLASSPFRAWDHAARARFGHP